MEAFVEIKFRSFREIIPRLTIQLIGFNIKKKFIGRFMTWTTLSNPETYLSDLEKTEIDIYIYFSHKEKDLRYSDKHYYIHENNV